MPRVWFIAAGVVLLIAFLVNLANRPSEPRPSSLPARPAATAFTERTVHIDARDLNGAMLPKGAPLFSERYMQGDRLAWLSHGETVTLVAVEGYTVRIRTSSGLDGWIEPYFVRELRK